MAKVCWATDSVEYPATFLHAIPRLSKYSLSRLFVPVAVTQTNLRFLAAPMEASFTWILFTMITSASWMRSGTSCWVEKGYFTTSPNRSNLDRSMSSPIVFTSKNTSFIVCLPLSFVVYPSGHPVIHARGGWTSSDTVWYHGFENTISHREGGVKNLRLRYQVIR